MNQSKTEAIPGPLAVAWGEGGSVPLVSEELMPADLQEAWQIQDALDERLDFSTGSPHEPVAAVPGAETVIRYGDVGEIRVTFEA